MDGKKKNNETKKFSWMKTLQGIILIAIIVISGMQLWNWTHPAPHNDARICKIVQQLQEDNFNEANALAVDLTTYPSLSEDDYTDITYLEYHDIDWMQSINEQHFGSMPDWVEAIDANVFESDAGRNENYYSFWASNDYLDLQDGYTGTHYSWTLGDPIRKGTLGIPGESETKIEC
jgi:hypothetical protein